MLSPAFAPPHKKGVPIASYADRMAMTELLVKEAGLPGLEVSGIEGELRYQPCYTCQVVEALTLRYPEDELLLLIGGDSLCTLQDWKNGRELAEKCSFITYPRHGWVFDPSIWEHDTAEKLQNSLMEGKFLEISSTFIRKSLENHGNTVNIIPESVEKYIREKHLYGC